MYVYTMVYMCIYSLETIWHYTIHTYIHSAIALNGIQLISGSKRSIKDSACNCGRSCGGARGGREDRRTRERDE